MTDTASNNTIDHEQEPLLEAASTVDLKPPVVSSPLSPLASPLSGSISALLTHSRECDEDVSSLPTPAPTFIRYEYLPTEVLGLIESYLPPSDCAHLSATSTFLHRRWTARRWQRTFQLHYGRGNLLRTRERMGKLRKSRKRLGRLRKLINECGPEPKILEQRRTKKSNSRQKGLCGSKLDLLFSDERSELNCIRNEQILALSKYNEQYADGWELTFVGCCHDHDSCSSCKQPNSTGVSSSASNNAGSNPINNSDQPPSLPNYPDDYCDDMSAFTTQFNVTALVPSVRRAYVDLWDTIELSLLGYYDTPETEYDQNNFNAHPPRYPVPAIMRILRTSVLPELAEYLFFVVGFKPLAARRGSTLRRRRRRDGGVMGPVLTRRLVTGDVDTAIASPPEQQSLTEIDNSRNGNDHNSVGNSSSHLTPQPPSSGTSKSSSCTGGEVAHNDTTANGVCPAEQSHLEDSGNANSSSTTTTLEEITSLRNTATTMSAWKLACILRERGVGCLRCAICDRIDLMGDDFDEDDFDTVLMAGFHHGEGGIDDSSEEDLQANVSIGNFMRHRSGQQHSMGEHRTNGGRSPFLREFQKRVGGGEAWTTPCLCQELVHRQCLEQKMRLIPKYLPWEYVKLRVGSLSKILAVNKDSTEQVGLHTRRRFSSDPHNISGSASLSIEHDPPTQESLAPRVWISYDNPLPLRRRQRANNGWGDVEEDVDGVIAVDHLGRFRSPTAMCETCGVRYLRTVRLPRSKSEVIAASLSDPISMMRAASTFIHFVLACALLAACEGMCSDESCRSHRTLLDTPLGVLKWPTTGLNGFALAWWQLQQCCMLHIFFSRRFAAIVDRLWMGPISLFYCRLYFYFIVTSALLAASYIPMVSRAIRIHIFASLMSPWLLRFLQPVGDFVAFVNLFQYAIVSTTVICIFWRTNYRIFTVADGKEAIATLRRREELARNMNMSLQANGFGRDGVRRRAVGAGAQAVRQPGHLFPHGNAMHQAELEGRVGGNAVPMQRIVGVGAGDNNAWHTHPIYHGPW